MTAPNASSGTTDTTSPERHSFEADDSGISCVHCGLPEPNARHYLSLERTLAEIRKHIVVLEEESSTINRALAGLYRTEQRLRTLIANRDDSSSPS